MLFERSVDPTAVMGRRILAFAIDLIVIGLICSVFYRPDVTGIDATNCAQVALDGGQRCVESGTSVFVVDYNLFGALSMQLGLWFLNAALLQGVTGATIGKTMLGLRCVKPNGQICGLGAAFLRTVLLVVDYAFCFLIGLVTASVSRGHRRLGDIAANTYVVRTSWLSTIPVVPPPQWTPNDN